MDTATATADNSGNQTEDNLEERGPTSESQQAAKDTDTAESGRITSVLSSVTSPRLPSFGKETRSTLPSVTPIVMMLRSAARRGR